MTADRVAAGYEPGWDIDYAWGRQGEFLFGDVLHQLADGQARMEVKSKRRLDDWFYIEVAQNARGRGLWKPSGLSVTGAEYWAWKYGDTGVYTLTPTFLLNEAVRRNRGTPTECARGDNPTRGRLVRLGDLLLLADTAWRMGVAS